jgi:hypothetical protein
MRLVRNNKSSREIYLNCSCSSDNKAWWSFAIRCDRPPTLIVFSLLVDSIALCGVIKLLTPQLLLPDSAGVFAPYPQGV